MRFRKIPILFFFVISLPLGAQVQSSSSAQNLRAEFRDEFDDCVTINKQERNMHILLPDWMAELSNTSNEGMLVAGLSDPFLDSATAVNQAILRAEAMASILNSCKRSELAVIFENEELYNSSRMLCVKIKNLLKSGDKHFNYDIERITFLNSGEAIVLISVGHGDYVSDSYTEVHYTSIINELNLKYDVLAHIECLIYDGQQSLRDQSMVYQSKDLISNDLDLDIKALRYLINMENDCEITGDTAALIPGYRTNAGLWSSYLSAVLSNIVALDGGKSQIKSMKDRYNDSEESIMDEKREMEYRIFLERFGFCKNHIFVHLGSVNE